MKDISIKLMVGIVVSTFVMSSLMVIPSTVFAQQVREAPDLVVRNIAWKFHVVEGEDLPVTVYVENIGTAPVQTGFWIEVKYAGLSGFWQEAIETHQIWVNPPIIEGTIKAVKFTTTALNTHQANFEASLDTTNTITETNENNNIKHNCDIIVEGIPGTSISVPIYVRNERTDMWETFTIEADETTIPGGWGFTGGLPPTTVQAAPGNNVIQSEGITVPMDTSKNAYIMLNTTRESDGASQSIAIRVITTPEMGFSFNHYTNELIVSGVNQIGAEVFVSSELISEIGHKTVTKYTVTNTRGQSISAVVMMKSVKQLNTFEITEIEYNGIAIITPDDSQFLTKFRLDKNGEVERYYQYMSYGSEIYSETNYDERDNQTTMIGKGPAGNHWVEFDGLEALGVIINNERIIPARLDTTNVTTLGGIGSLHDWSDCYMLLH